MKKKILCSFILATGILSCSLAFASVTVEAAQLQQAQEIEYVYKLLGEELTIGKDVVSILDPKGNELTASEGKILLDWASGSYKITYPDYVQDVRVYEKAPKDSVVFAENTEEFHPIAGLKTQLPKATVIPGIYRTDGAPNPENYTYEIEVYENGTCLDRIEAGEEYAFTIGGAYTLSYVYENVFGLEDSYSVSITAVDEKIIVNHLQDEYAMCDSFTTEDIYGYYKGQKYPAAITLESTSETYEVTDKYTFNEVGEYQLRAEVTVAGEELSFERRIEIESSLDDFILPIKGAAAYGGVDKLSSTAFVSNAQGYQVYTTGISSQIDYNGVIDLRTFDENESILEIVPNVLPTAGNVESVRITMTDVYDSSNTVSIGYVANTNRNGLDYTADNVLVYVMYGTSGRVANANYFNMPQYAVGWYTSIYGYWTSTEFSKVNEKFNENVDTFNFAFDIENNIIYTHGIFYQVPAPGVQATPTVREWYPLLDLESDTLAKPFQGFTTGEVYLKIETTGAGDIGIAKVGKHTFNQVTGEEYHATEGILLNDENYFIQGVKGKEFPVAKATPSKYMQSAITTQVKGPDGSVVTVKNDAFLPTEAGGYQVAYSGVNEFGVTIEKSYTVQIGESATPIQIKYDASETLLAGEWYEIKKPTVTGGNGNVNYVITLDGKPVEVGESVKITQQSKLVITAEDVFGQSVKKTWILLVDNNNVEVNVDFPRTGFTGERFVVPTASFYDYATQSYQEDYTVTYNGQVLEDSEITLPSSPCEVEFCYSLNGEYERRYTLQVLSKAFTSPEEVFFVDGEISANNFGTEFTVATNSLISFPHLLSANALNISFYVLESKLDFDSVTFTLTSISGITQQITLSDMNKSNVAIYVNGVNTQKTLTRVAMVGDDNAPEAYRNKTYYSYEFTYEEKQGGLIANDKILYPIALDANGKAFNGFGGGVYLDISIQSQKSTASILLRKVSNQILSDLAYSEGDIIGPQVYSDGLSENARIDYGATMDFSSFKAFDVLSSAAKIELTLQLPDGTTLFSQSEPSQLGENAKVTANLYGMYRLTVRMTDNNGVVATAKINYSVEDLISPELTINNKVEQTYEVGATIKLLTCQVSDNNVGEITLMVLVNMPKGNSECVHLGQNFDELKLTLSQKGKYKVSYYAIDAAGNITVDHYYIIAR